MLCVGGVTLAQMQGSNLGVVVKGTFLIDITKCEGLAHTHPDKHFNGSIYKVLKVGSFIVDR